MTAISEGLLQAKGRRMRQAIISDVHANVAALEQVLRCIERERCDQVICLGDNVGYGPFPNECVEMVHATAAVTLAGNHDHAVLGWTSMEDFNEYAQEALLWSRPRMRAEATELMKKDPLLWRHEDLFYVHATPFESELWHYVLNAYDAATNFGAFSEQVCFVGHSHHPAIFSLNRNNQIRLQVTREVQLESEQRYIINVGSVGQPRDGNPDAAFVIYDTEQKYVRWIRVEYDVAATQQAMRQFGLPSFLIRRLAIGH
jgi:predicted phosphodiesterase